MKALVRGQAVVTATFFTKISQETQFISKLI